MISLLPADVVIVKANGVVPRLIRFFTRSPGESKSWASHVALAVSPTHVVEAATNGVHYRALASFPAGGVTVWRARNLSVNARERIAATGRSYVGDAYGFEKVPLHLLDWMLGGLYVFRRLATVDNAPLCSWLVAASYAREGLYFGVHVGAATPDDIHDFVRRNPRIYERIP